MNNNLSPYDYGMILTFLVGYLFIAIDYILKINKATVALLMAVITWSIAFLSEGVASPEMHEFLFHHIGITSQVIFFLLAALTIVEIINSHEGFKVVTQKIKTQNPKTLLWVISFIAFFLSAIIDNLTTTIVMVTILQKIIPARNQRLLFGGAVVIAANAGGAWTPIGDVTTTMLWIGEQLTTLNIVKSLFFPSLLCMLASTFVISRQPIEVKVQPAEKEAIPPFSKKVFYLGLSLLLFVPIFKTLTGLPPFMGMFLGLSILWFVTDLMLKDKEHDDPQRVTGVLTRIDHASTLFFLGILLTVDALDAVGLLKKFALFLDHTIPSPEWIAITLGFASAIVDNVPLVAASMGMYPLSVYPTDAPFWQLLAYCAGTGGSMLIIGSAAGVAYMGMENVTFTWYLKKISLAALIGYIIGLIVFVGQKLYI